jgi:putative oxidoreductase
MTMNIALWILQVLLAIIFLWHGWLFVSPPTELLEVMNALLAGWFRVFLGVAEILAAIGLVLPSLSRIQPWLTPLAATGLMIVMLSASVLHFSRGEMSTAITTLVLFVLVTAVAYLRWKVRPIAPRVAASA